MVRYTDLIFVACVALAACSRQPIDSRIPETDSEPATVTMALPAGDVGAGRQAFQDLRCTTCHAVPSEKEFPVPVSASAGPVIDARMGQLDVSYLVASIMTPSHAMSLNLKGDVQALRLEGTRSPMGDFSYAMTVRQLVDLYAYLRSVK